MWSTFGWRGIAILLIFVTGHAGPAAAGETRRGASFQPRNIERFRLPEADTARLGWTPVALDALLDYVATLSTDTFIIMTDGQVVASAGDPEKAYDLHSMRKAMLSALVGMHIGPGPGRIPLDATIEQLGIDDHPRPLSPLQKQATVLHLLKSVSGINHAAAAEAGMAADKDRRLGRADNRPGSIWAYNNWDYNALTSVFERRTGLTVGEAFRSEIAAPCGMEDFGPDSVRYLSEPERSEHRAAMFRMSGRDLLRFGRLYLDRGKAGGRQIVPEDWIDRITGDYTPTGIPGLRAGHGYLWWVPGRETGLPEGTFCAWGLGQQALFVIPRWHTVVVHQADMAPTLARWSDLRSQGLDDDAALERLIVSCQKPGAEEDAYCKDDRFISRREFDGLIERLVAARRP